MTHEDTISEAREEMTEMEALVKMLPPEERITLKAERIQRLVDLFDVVMKDALEHAEQNRAMRATISIADKMLAKRDGIDLKEPLL
jgi:hypothetical protein